MCRTFYCATSPMVNYRTLGFAQMHVIMSHVLTMFPAEKGRHGDAAVSVYETDIFSVVNLVINARMLFYFPHKSLNPKRENTFLLMLHKSSTLCD